jgi:hypothetical protein
MSELKKRKLIIITKEKEQLLVDLCDLALKGSGMQALQCVNAVASSIEEEDLPAKASKKHPEPPAD